jgi:predicted permease
LVVGLNIRTGGYAESHPVNFYERLQHVVAELPGVQAAGLSGFPLLANRGWGGGFEIRGRQMDSEAETSRLTVSESFFHTLGIPILQGRGFESTDAGDATKVVVVNEKFGRSFLAGESPVGLTFTMLGIDWRIVGVCRDTKYDNIKKPVQPTAYFPYRQMFFKPSISKNLGTASIAVRTALPPLAFSAAVRKAVAQIDPSVAITSITTQKGLRDQGISQERLLATTSSFLALLAVLLSCIGLYGLMAYTVARRSGEIAIRIAVGAQPGAVARSVLGEALILAAIGIGAGLPAVFAVTGLIKSQLYGVPPNDPSTLVVVILVLVSVALLAAWVPARRASRVNPMTALRTE